jgi:cytochrome c-type biogenesis protein CcmH
MTQDRPADAAKIFERTVNLAGRQPELLGQWAQAQYFADGKQWSEKIQALTDEALKADPKEVTSLGLLGIAAFEGQRYQQAIDYWNRLLEQLPPDDQSRVALQGGITRATEKLVASGGKVAEAPAAKPAARLKVHVDLAAELKARSSRATASSSCSRHFRPTRAVGGQAPDRGRLAGNRRTRRCRRDDAAVETVELP